MYIWAFKSYLFTAPLEIKSVNRPNASVVNDRMKFAYINRERERIFNSQQCTSVKYITKLQLREISYTDKQQGTDERFDRTMSPMPGHPGQEHLTVEVATLKTLN